MKRMSAALAVAFAAFTAVPAAHAGSVTNPCDQITTLNCSWCQILKVAPFVYSEVCTP